MSKQKPYTVSAIREARWIVAEMAPGTPWCAGAFHHASTEQGLIRMGVLVPTDDPDMFTIAHIDNIDSLPVRK